jgi:hypothetical protein
MESNFTTSPGINLEGAKECYEALKIDNAVHKV